MALLRVAAISGLSAFLLGITSSGCAKSDAIEPPTGAAATGAGAGGDDASGPGSGGAAATGSGGGDGSGGDATAPASTSQSTAGAGGAGAGPAGTGGGGGSAACGNGAIDGGEACDGDELGGATCVSEGFPSGTIACDADCALDTSGCNDVAACDNGLDDDDDGLLDDEDPGCTSADDDDELVYSATCDGAGAPVVDLTTVEGLTVDYLGTTDDPGVIVNNFTSTVGGSCPSTPGPEVALRFEVASTIATLVISLDNPGTETDWDPVLYVRSATCTGAQVGCNDDGDGLASVLVLSNVQPGAYYVFVDGRTAGDVGDFEITLTPS